MGSGLVYTSGVSAANPVDVLSGGTFAGTVDSGGKLTVLDGGLDSGTTIVKGGIEIVSSGGVASGGTGSGTEIVSNGATANDTTVASGATLAVLSGGAAAGAAVGGGGTEMVSAGGSAIATTVSSGGALDVLSGGVADPTIILSGGRETISAHGIDDGGQISGGTQLIYGLASGATIFAGTQGVENGGTAIGTTASGGILTVAKGGRAIDAAIDSGGTEIIAVGGTGAATAGSGADFGALINSGTFNVGDAGTLVLGGAVVSNAGSIDLGNGSGATLLIDTASGGSVTLSGGGRITLSSGTTDTIRAGGSGVTLINKNNTITGGGAIGVGDEDLTLVNSGTIDANVSGSHLLLETGSNTITNAGTLEATAHGILVIESNVANLGTIEASGTNAGVVLESIVSDTSAALILASGSGEQVDLLNATISGGKLQTIGSNALILAGSGVNAIDDTIIMPLSVVEAISGTLNANNVTMGADAVLAAFNGGIMTLSGGLIASGDAVGAGLGGTANIVGSVKNSASVQAIGTGVVVLGGTLTNANGVIFASDSGAQIELDNATISGGTLRTSSGAVINVVSGAANVLVAATIAGTRLLKSRLSATVTLSGGTIGNGAIVQTLSDGTAIVGGTIVNDGTLYAVGSGSLVEIISGAVVNGGIAEVGNGVVDIQGASSESVSPSSPVAAATSLSTMPPPMPARFPALAIPATLIPASTSILPPLPSCLVRSPRPIAGLLRPAVCSPSQATAPQSRPSTWSAHTSHRTSILLPAPPVVALSSPILRCLTAATPMAPMSRSLAITSPALLLAARAVS